MEEFKISILNFFPYQNFRKYQADILREIEDNFGSYDYIFLETPTGLGKSGVAYTEAKWAQENGWYTHFCVRDKYLQEQYLRDFKDIALVKGRGNFTCSFTELIRALDGTESQAEVRCDEAVCMVNKKFDCPYKPSVERDENDPRLPKRDDHGLVYTWMDKEEPYCPYWVQKVNAIQSDLTIHNYHYFLFEQTYSKSFTKRKLGVFDEAHMIESILMDFVQERITRSTFQRIFDHIESGIYIGIPNYDTIDDWLQWLFEKREQLKKIEKIYDALAEQTSRKEQNINILRFYRMVERIKNLIRDITQDRENWVWLREERGVTFKPITIHKYSEYLFKHVDKKLLMSATILDHEKLKRYLGIEEEVKFLRVHESTFPIENRPIIQDYQGKASVKTMSAYLPKLLTRIDDHYIPEKSVNKGVIHTHTNRIAEYILQNSKHHDIMMSNTGSEKKREEVFQEFFDSEPPKVMISPSMNLGVDLKDDLCRWQVIAKVPYPNLGDPQIRKRFEMDKGWYDWITLMMLIQTYGRGCRSDIDWCDTYVTDSMFAFLVHRNRDMVPRWFMEAIRR